MYTNSVQLTFNIAHSSSLKDKRKVRRSMIDKIRLNFNVSIAETDNQDKQRTLTLGIAVVSDSDSRGKQYLEDIIRYTEENFDVELLEIIFQ